MRKSIVRFGSLLLLTAIALALTTTSGQAQQTVGLFLNTEDAYPGYTLWAPRNETTYLIDNDGREVHSWTSVYLPGNTAYVLPNGNLVRTGKDGPKDLIRFLGGGHGGRVEILDWDSNVLWTFLHATNDYRLHHDIEVLPNGNILMISWELKSEAEAIQAGRDPALISEGELWPDYIIEVEPVGATDFNIVWEWHIWDHLIQDFDPTKDNFGIIFDHPELLDINHVFDGSNPGRANWLHTNSIDYNAELDQIMIGSPRSHEIYVIDHSTTTEEAAGHTGGIYGKGGDFLYRWGNPRAYDRGGPQDQMFFGGHHDTWIDPGLPGEGHVLFYNNRAGGNYSRVDEFVSPVDGSGFYPMPIGQHWGPDELEWSYVHTPPEEFFSGGLSGAQRLPNGNTLICEGRGATTAGEAANFFEVTDAGDIVWRYVNPVGNAGPIMQGGLPTSDFNSFRVQRYPLDYPGFDGQDLTPGDPIELFNAPPPAPDGDAGTTAMTVAKLMPDASILQLYWDAATCTAFDYNVIYGNLADVSSYGLLGAQCGLGTTGLQNWDPVPAGDLFFLIVGEDDTGVYESSWGVDSSGAERKAVTPSGQCGITNKVLTGTCP